MKHVLLLFTLLIAPTYAMSSEHPVRQIVTLSDTIDEDMVSVCEDLILDNPTEVETSPECDHLAERGAELLSIMVNSLTAEEFAINKENRFELLGIAYDELSLFEMAELGMLAFALDDPAIYLAKNHPDMVTKYMDAETFAALKLGGII